MRRNFRAAGLLLRCLTLVCGAVGAVPLTARAEAPLVVSYRELGEALATTGEYDAPTGERVSLMPFHRIAAHLIALQPGASDARAACRIPGVILSASAELAGILGSVKQEPIAMKLAQVRSDSRALYNSSAPAGAGNGAVPDARPFQDRIEAMRRAIERHGDQLRSHRQELEQLLIGLSGFIAAGSGHRSADRYELAGALEGVGYFIPSALRVDWIELRNQFEPILTQESTACGPEVVAQVSDLREPFIILRAWLEAATGTHYPRLPLDQRSIGAGLKAGRPAGAAAPKPDVAEPAEATPPEGESEDPGDEAGDV